MKVPTFCHNNVPCTAFRMTALLLVIATVEGCNRRPEVAPVLGRITLSGRALGPGRIYFMPPTGGKAAVGRFGPDGRYMLSTFVLNDGAIVGHHRVMLSDLSPENQKSGLCRPIIPPAYSNPTTTPLTADVTRGRNEIDFDLTP